MSIDILGNIPYFFGKVTMIKSFCQQILVGIVLHNYSYKSDKVSIQLYD